MTGGSGDVPALTEEWVDCDGLRIRHAVGGQADAPPVVLLHGGGLDAAMVSWKYIAPSLATDYRVYAPDWPGYGESDPPERTPTVDYYIEVLERYCATLDLEAPAVASISMGGAVALGYSLAYPERVDRLVAIDSYGLGSDIPGGLAAALFANVGILNRLVWWATRRWDRLAVAGVEAATHEASDVDELVADALRELDRPRATRAWQAFQRAEIGLRSVRTSYVEELSELAVPTLFLHGEYDAFVPVEWAVRASTLVPDAELTVLECGHWSTRERPDEVTTLVREFLS